MVVASLNSADVFRVRQGGHCRKFVVQPYSKGAPNPNPNRCPTIFNHIQRAPLTLTLIVVQPYSKGANFCIVLGEVRAPFETEVSATSYHGRMDTGIACLTSIRLDV